MNGYSPNTKYYTEEGGLQGERQTKDSEDAVAYLIKEYGDYIRVKGVGSNGHMEITLFDKNKNKNKK